MDEKELVAILTAPPTRKDSLQISVKRIYTDVNGVIVDKNDVAIPDSLKVKMPVYLFGEYDRQGGNYLNQKSTPPQPNVFYLCNFIYGISNPLFFGFSGLSDIQLQLKAGDLVTVYTDNLVAPTYFVWMVQSLPNRPLGSFMANLCNLPVDEKYGFLKSVSFDYYSDNVNQWSENIQWINYDYLGLVSSNYLEPSQYLTPKTPANGFVQIRWQTILTQYIGLNFYMLFDTDNITINFQLRIKK